MKRSVVAIAVLTLMLFAACATTGTSATPTTTGTITAIEGNSITIQPADGGTPVTVTVSRDTKMSWYNGIDAERSVLVKGHKVSVWTPEGAQNATRLVITQ